MAEKDKDVLDFEALENTDFLSDIKLDDDLPNSSADEKQAAGTPAIRSDDELLKALQDSKDEADDKDIADSMDFTFDDEHLDEVFQDFANSGDAMQKAETEPLAPETKSATALSEAAAVAAPAVNEKREENDIIPDADSQPNMDGDEYSYGEHDQKQLQNLQWYSGALEDDVYEISPENMPDVVDSDRKIRILQVNVDSGYGWNVFFSNGVFMNLRDLAEYQERHGYIPYDSGKIIYGSKTTAFEKIEKIIVYENPKYFEYKIR